MKTLILSMLVLTIASVSNAQNVNIPDTAFLHALIDKGVDTNEDSLISYAEAEAVTSLIFNGDVYFDEDTILFIENLNGIEAFTNLDSLFFMRTLISNLNFSNNTALVYLYCSDNQLTNLDVSNNTALEYLNCSDNQLTSLDVSNNTALTELNCDWNQLTSLDISGCTALKELGCSENDLTSLDISGCTALKELGCSENNLASLDVSDCTALKNLSCRANKLTSLDISNNTSLTVLDCSYNSLISLDVSNNTALQYFWIDDIPTLNEVCVWIIPFPPAGVYVATEGSPNVQYTTDCATNIKNDYKETTTIDIYPNPSDDIINLEIENINNTTIEIYNVSGRLVLSKSLYPKQEKIDISGLQKGIYFVKVRQENNVRIEKLIVY